MMRAAVHRVVWDLVNQSEHVIWQIVKKIMKIIIIFEHLYWHKKISHSVYAAEWEFQQQFNIKSAE